MEIWMKFKQNKVSLDLHYFCFCLSYVARFVTTRICVARFRPRTQGVWIRPCTMEMMEEDDRKELQTETS